MRKLFGIHLPACDGDRVGLRIQGWRGGDLKVNVDVGTACKMSNSCHRASNNSLFIFELQRTVHR